MNRFKFEFADLRIDSDKGPLEFLDFGRGPGQCRLECLESGVGLVPKKEALGDVVDDLLADFAGQLFYPFKECRGLPVEANDLDLAVDTFRDSKNRLVERAPGDREFLMETREELKVHSLIRRIM